MRTLVALPPNETGSITVFNQSSIFQYRFEDEATDLRKQAENMPHGVCRDEVLRRAHQIDVALNVTESLPSPNPRTST